MTDTPKDGGPATHPPGMSLRDYFAGQALLAITHHKHDLLYKIVSGVADQRTAAQQDTASIAYALADAMLAEREKDKQS